jgi:hypothetical protein
VVAVKYSRQLSHHDRLRILVIGDDLPVAAVRERPIKLDLLSLLRGKKDIRESKGVPLSEWNAFRFGWKVERD